MKKILLAIGNKQYSELLTRNFNQHSDFFSVANQEVLHHRFLEELVDAEMPNILILHDYYLESDFIRPELKEKEWQTFIHTMRMKYDDSLRIVFLCERPRGDLFLASLVSLGIKDIFNERSINVDVLISQLKDTPRFSNVEKFLRNSEPTLLDIENEKPYEDNNTEKGESTLEKPIVQKVIEKKVIEKKVIQKVVNKNVVKREYKIQVTNQTEKIIGVPVKRKLIMIGSPISRSGSTFIGHLLARTLSQLGVTSTYVESPFFTRNYSFDRFMGGRTSQNYRSKFYQFLKDEPKFDSDYTWVKQEVDIICKNPTLEPIYTTDDIPFDSFLKVLFSVPSTVTIIDVGTDWHLEVIQDLMDIVDHAFFVIEPDIPYIQYLEESEDAAATFLSQQLNFEKSALIGNRFDESVVHYPLIKDLYKSSFLTYFPAFPVADVFQAQYQGIFLNDLKDYQKKIDPFILPLLDIILPEEFMKKQKKGTGLFRGLFNKKINVEKIEVKGERTNETIR